MSGVGATLVAEGVVRMHAAATECYVVRDKVGVLLVDAGSPRCGSRSTRPSGCSVRVRAT
ncbi:hypothetical protein ACFO3K_10285 [Cellulomonas algicola]|uniref:hypothetical protein n=1 Tax=Cellulomonas algicola TaxID=2071633 RepID=UPI000F57FE02|nr:hypothetical protein [Cellulomonas algicola]